VSGLADPHANERLEMAREVELEMRELARALDAEGLDPRVREVLLRVPRHAFVGSAEAPYAYDNRPLPIGHGQTISQPLVVAAMTQVLAIRPDHRVLEIGTGCGYQTAMLAELAAEVVSLEVVAPLAEAARERLASLGYANVEIHVADGWRGWPDRAPYDGILVTAAASVMPTALVEQLAPGGRMVLPLGSLRWGQDLVLVEKDAEGRVGERRLFPVAFVPMVAIGRPGP
jgi:protein-L-isoaspartate(D-aspartate) O-methyltransferase